MGNCRPVMSNQQPTEMSGLMFEPVENTPARELCVHEGGRRLRADDEDAIFLWKIEWAPDTGYDVWTSAIVAAKTADAAMDIHPSGTLPNWSNSDVQIIRQWAADDRWAPSSALVRPTRVGVADSSIHDGEVVLVAWMSG